MKKKNLIKICQERNIHFKSTAKKQNIINMLDSKSTKFIQLANTKNNLTEEVVFNAVIEQPTLLKRPLLNINDNLQVGFKVDTYQELFKK